MFDNYSSTYTCSALLIAIDNINTVWEIGLYPNTPSIIDLARVPIEGVFEVLAYQFDNALNVLIWSLYL